MCGIAGLVAASSRKNIPRTRRFSATLGPSACRSKKVSSPAPFGLTELSNGYVAYNEPFNFGSLSIGGMTYGFDLYRESKVVLGYSYNYENILFAGATVNYHTYSIKNYGSTSAFYFNLGGLVYILDELRWGFVVNNLNRASIADTDNQIPMVLSTGFSYDILQKHVEGN